MQSLSGFLIESSWLRFQSEKFIEFSFAVRQIECRTYFSLKLGIWNNSSNQSSREGFYSVKGAIEMQNFGWCEPWAEIVSPVSSM